MDFEEFIKHAKTSIDKVGESFDEEDDDFLPVMLLYGKGDPESEQEGLVIAGLDPEFLSTEEAKDRLAYTVLPGLVWKSEAKHFCYVSSGWSSKNISLGRPSEDPTRDEIVMMACGSQDGSYFFDAALIDRQEGEIPTVGEWGYMTGSGNVSDENASATLIGRLVDPSMIACIALGGDLETMVVAVKKMAERKAEAEEQIDKERDA